MCVCVGGGVKHLLLELYALSPTCNEMPHKHTANPNQLRRLIVSPISDAAKSRVDTSYRERVQDNSRNMELGEDQKHILVCSSKYSQSVTC